MCEKIFASRDVDKAELDPTVNTLIQFPEVQTES